MIKKDIINYKNYGRCIKLSNGTIDVVATLDIGPRIVFFGFKEGTNIMNNQKEKFGKMNNELFDNFFYKGAAFENFGGHRLWASPEKLPDTYYPDCNPVEYTLTDTGVVLTPPPQSETGLAMKTEISLSCDKPAMDICHYMTNISKKNIKKALWALSVCEQNGILIIPMNTNDTGLLHNRNISVWPYTNLSDNRLYFGNKYITVKQDPNAKTPLKMGFDLNDGKVYYALNDVVFSKKYYPNHPNGIYPDGGVSMETYTNDLFIEIETLSELKNMAPNDTNIHRETWEIYKSPCSFNETDDKSIENFISKIK